MESETIFSKRCVITMYICTAVVIFLVAIVIVVIPRKGCSIDLNNDFTDFHPLLLKKNSLDFDYPSEGSKIFYKSGETLRMACSGKDNYFLINKQTIIETICVEDKTFLVGYTHHHFSELNCVNYIQSSTKISEDKCFEKYTQIEIGFETSAGFVNLITTCFDDTKKDSLYSVHNLYPNINYTQKVLSNPPFEQEQFYGNQINISSLFNYSNQKDVFKKILNKNDNFISKNQYFNRGHLAPKGDFIYAAQKRATFYYINVAPQWKDFNDGNWERLESSCRDFAIKRNLNLIVYTGIYEQAKLKDVNGNPKPISLYLDENNNQLLSVPQIFWKILYDPNSESATVFIGHNNPQDTGSSKICKDICDDIEWIKWNPENKNKGISYCCEYEKVKKIISKFPDISVNNLLK